MPKRFAYECDHCGGSKSYLFDADKEAPRSKRCAQCGKRAYKSYGPTVHTTPTRGWPLYCEAVGVMPNQVEDAKRADRVNGVTCDITPDGRRVFTSARHYKKWQNANGYFNKSDWY